MKATYLVHIEFNSSGKCVVTVPKLPGCRATAASFEQALDAVRTAIEAHVKALAKAGAAIPVESRESPALCVQVAVEIPTAKRNTKRRP